MNGQNIMDALGFLDDDLIEATGKLRRKKRGLYWLMPAVTAACLCVVLLAAINPSKAAPEAMKNHDGNSIVSDSLHDAVIEESPMEAAGTVKEIAIAVLQVTEITETGFSGTVADMYGGEDLKSMTITITCSSDIAASLAPGDLVQVRYRTDENNSLIDFELVGE